MDISATQHDSAVADLQKPNRHDKLEVQEPYVSSQKDQKTEGKLPGFYRAVGKSYANYGKRHSVRVRREDNVFLVHDGEKIMFPNCSVTWKILTTIYRQPNDYRRKTTDTN
ncbi:unnamed protein product [Acanthoscelides obtectus]|uniref:Uncharacterized protein n=1 Tax=Acanthoscelides obtectus TaxID=200917 RepID=A0A9P0JHX1_ACAOB|nr:unnamed protein product [Acanthoscelides obtectus]CAK1624908.1 hypothetical protein AOBTE_LOCUS2843 [Acanthoscelides obtectus]